MIFNTLMQQIIRIVIAMFLIVYSYYVSYWFTLQFKISFLNINLQNVTFLLLALILVIEYLNYKKNKKVDYFHVLFWFITLILIISFYLGTIQAFMIDLNNIQDYLIKNNLFYLKIDYSYRYKVNFYYQYLDNYILTNNLLLGKQDLILKIIKGSLNDSILNLSLAELRYYIPSVVDIAYLISQAHDVLNLGEKIALYSSAFYGIVQSVKALIMVLTVFKFIYQDLPYVILTTFFPLKTWEITVIVLLNTPGVVFQMTVAEFLEFSLRLSEILLRQENALRLLFMDFNDIPYLN